jgi:hypothetical protein
MSQLVDVGTWVALITGVIGITLSIVAIWFTFSVESRSRRVTEQMIKSLQKIETAVERSSADTQGLIKVGWDRMLGGMGVPTPQDSSEASDSANNQIAAGLAEELRSDLVDSGENSASTVDEDRIVQRVKDAILAQLRTNRPSNSSVSGRVDAWMRSISSLSPTSYELVRLLLSFGHMNRSAYRGLSAKDSTYAEAIDELRRRGILVPLKGEGEPRREQPVYWFIPGESAYLRTAFGLTSRNYSEIRHNLEKDLKSVGYHIMSASAADDEDTNGKGDK